jgi:hypothetical protein
VKSIALIALLALGASFDLSAQTALSKSKTLPTVDGIVGGSEYQYSSTSANGIKISVTLGSDDNLYIAVEAATSGWVAAGVGGLVMNGSRLFLGAIQDGKPAFIEKAGIGHFYTDAKTLVAQKWAVTTKGADTTLELCIPASAALYKGRINAIFAYAKSPSFTTKHAAHTSISFSVN